MQWKLALKRRGHICVCDILNESTTYDSTLIQYVLLLVDCIDHYGNEILRLCFLCFITRRNVHSRLHFLKLRSCAILFSKSGLMFFK